MCLLMQHRLLCKNHLSTAQMTKGANCKAAELKCKISNANSRRLQWRVAVNLRLGGLNRWMEEHWDHWGFDVLCWSDVHSKLRVNMVWLTEVGLTRLIKEERNGPGRKRSRQKFPRRVVLGSRLWIAIKSQLSCRLWTRFFAFLAFQVFRFICSF